MAPTYKIAVIQLHPKPLQVEENFQNAANFIRSAAQQGAELAVLPEYRSLQTSLYTFPSLLTEPIYLTNWVPKDPNFKSSCASWKEYLDKYRKLAKECNICIVPGTICELHLDTEHDSTGVTTEDDANSERMLNVAYFIGFDGKILGKYVKKNLWGSIERLHLTSSTRDPHPVFDTPFGKVGMLICWDLAFPEAFREMIAQGAKLFIIPTFWTLNDCSKEGLARNPTAEITFLDAMLTARCFENTCAIVFANAGGPPGKGYAGISQVVAPYTGSLVRLGSCAEGMAVVDLDMQILEEAEENYQVRADLARGDWHYDYRHKNTEDNDSKLLDESFSS